MIRRLGEWFSPGTPTSPDMFMDDERGDVPGWVLITLMTAAIVIVLWSVAGPALEALFHQAVNRFTSF